MTLKSVDLPAPLGPIRPVIEPSAIVDRDAVDGTDAAEVHVEILDPDHAALLGRRPARAGPAGRRQDQR